MSIQKLVKLAAAAVLTGLLVCAATFFFGINAIRLGGERARQLQLASDLQADILPPPLYLVEARLEAEQSLVESGTPQPRIAKLRQLEKDFDTRVAYWRDEDMALDLKAQIAGPVAEPGRRFWQIVNRSLIPAMERRDLAAARVAVGELDQAYLEHRRGVDALVSAADRYKQDVEAAAARSLLVTSCLLGLLGTALIVGILFLSRALLRRVVDPLGALAGATSGLAEGEALAIPGLSRGDELGRLAQAVDHFRHSAEERRQADAQAAEERTRIIEALAGALTRMAQGDLRKLLETELTGDYGKIGDNLNHAIATLREMVQGVVFGAGSIEQAARRIADATHDLSTRTQANAAAIEETRAALAGVDERIASSREAGRRTAESAARASAAVEQGRARAQAAAATMEEVREAAASVDKVMEALDKIAFQTRVLAMNAAIEAGAAGAAGKGFAVVAGLVSQLAIRAEAEAHAAREQLTATSDRIAGAVTTVGEVEREFAGIVTEVGTVTNLVDCLADDAEAQAVAVAEIATAIRQIDSSTQRNAEMVDQTGVEAETLRHEARNLVYQAETFEWNRRTRDVPVPIDRRRSGRGAAAASTSKARATLVPA